MTKIIPIKETRERDTVICILKARYYYWSILCIWNNCTSQSKNNQVSKFIL